MKTLHLAPRLLAAAALLSLAACAQPSRSSNMTVVDAARAPAGQQYRVAEVTGGKKTNPIIMSQVDNGAFQTALERSLEFAGLLDNGSQLGIYAELQKLDQPFAGFDMEVTAAARYVVRAPSGEVLFDEVIETPYTADFSSAFLGMERLRKANEGAIRTNINAFMQRLMDARPELAKPQAAGTPVS